MGRDDKFHSPCGRAAFFGKPKWSIRFAAVCVMSVRTGGANAHVPPRIESENIVDADREDDLSDERRRHSGRRR